MDRQDFTESILNCQEVDIARKSRFLACVSSDDGFSMERDRIHGVRFHDGNAVAVTFNEYVGEGVESGIQRFTDAHANGSVFSIDVYVVDGKGERTNTAIQYRNMSVGNVRPGDFEYGSDEIWRYEVLFEPSAAENQE